MRDLSIRGVKGNKISGALIGGVIGGVIGFYAGGNVALGYAIGSAIGGAYDYSQLPDTQGPRLQDRTVQVSTYGAQIPIVFGASRIAGNVIWPKNFSVTEHSQSQSSKGGPETVTFSYTATFALLLCEGPISGIGRIWGNKKLLHNPNATPTTDPAIPVMRVYLGSETQQPDPLMVATDGSSPAYLGWAYIVFEGLELTSSGFGNRPPFLEVEVFTSSLVTGPPAPRVIPLGASAAVTGGGVLALVDPVTGLIWSAKPSAFENTVNVAVNSDDTKSRIAVFSLAVTNFSMTSMCFVTSIFPSTPGEVWVAGEKFGGFTDQFAIFTAGTLPAYKETVEGLYHGTANIQGLAYNPVTQRVMAFRFGGGVSLYTQTTRLASTLSNFNIGDGFGALGTVQISKVLVTPLYFAVFYSGTGDGLILRRLSDYGFHAQYAMVTTVTNLTPVFYDADRNRIVIANNSGLSFQLIDITAGTSATYTYTAAAGADTSPPVSANIAAATYSNGKYIFGTGGSTSGGSTLYLVDPTSLVCVNTFTYEAYAGVPLMIDPLLSPLSSDKRYVFSFDRGSVKRLSLGVGISPLSVTLSSIVQSLCTRVPYGLATTDIDVTQLTDSVDGYLVGQIMPRRPAIEQLTAAYFFDAVESDHKIKFVKRGAAPVVTIVQDDRAAHEDGGEFPAHLGIKRLSELELPWMLDVKYTDKGRDYQVGTQYARRITRNANDPRSIELAIVMSADKAAQVALVNLYQPWLRMQFSFSTSLAYAKYEPTDVVTLPTDNVTYTARIVSRNDQGNGVIQWEAQLEDIAIYTQTGTVAASNFAPQTITDPGTTILKLLDIPLLRDIDDNAGYYVAMGGTTPGWTGAQLYKSVDNGSTYTSVLSSTVEATIGAATTVLGNFTAGNIFDNGNAVTVILIAGGPLLSATETQVLNGVNTAVIGAPGRWEVINFKTATLTATNTYALSGLLRGRRGTEWATGLHTSSDAFVLASTSAWQRVNPGAAELGLARLYKAPPFRTALGAAVPESFTDLGVGLEPYAPVNLAGTRDGSGNLTITWKRRSRIGYGTLNAMVPLGEAVESYSTDIMNGATVLRTLASATQTAAYTSAMQVTDFGSNQAAVTVNVYQISATVARGYALNGTI